MLFICKRLDRKEYANGEYCHNGKHDVPLGDECEENVSYEGDACNGERIGKLRGYVGHMVALCAGAGHDGSIGDGRAVVAANASCKACRHTYDEKGIVCREDRRYDGDKDTEGSPGGSRREGKADSYEEDDSGKEVCKACSRTGHKGVNVNVSTEKACHILKAGCKGKDKDSGNHCDKALGHARHSLLEVYNAAAHKIYDGEYEGNECAEGKTYGCICVTECACEIHMVIACCEEAANVEEGENADGYENDNGEKKVENDSAGICLFLFNAFALAAEVEVAFKCVKLVSSHGAVVKLHKNDSDDEYEGKDRVEVVGDSLDKESKAVDVACILCIVCNCSSPGGDRCDHTNGGCGSVDEVSKLCAGDVCLVCNGAHNCTNSEAVEVVVDEDENAEDKGADRCANLGLDVLLCPAAECGTTACAVYEGNHNAEDNEERKDTCSSGDGADKSVLDNEVNGLYHVEVSRKETARDNTDNERGVNLLRYKSEGDSDNGSEKGSPGGVVGSVGSNGATSSAGLAGLTCAISASHCSIGVSAVKGDEEKKTHNDNSHYKNENGAFFHCINLSF